MTRVRGTVLCFLIVGLLAASAGAGSMWTYKASGVKWHKVTTVGTLLVGGDGPLVSLNPETGKPMWTRNEFAGVSEAQVDEVGGTPFVLVSKVSGGLGPGSSIFQAIYSLTGDTAWTSDKLKGAVIGVFPYLQKDVVLVLTSPAASAGKASPDMLLFRLSSGDLLWEQKMDDKVDLFPTAKTSRFIQHFDLSGHQDPAFTEDSVYLNFAGVHRYDLATGKLVWKSAFDVTEGRIKQGNASLVVDGDLVISSAKGQLRAFDRNSGVQKWMSPDFGAAVAEMMVHGDVIYARMGGTFYDYGKKDWDLKKPLGVVTLNKNSGAVISKYDKANDAITNMVYFDKDSTLLIADRDELVGLTASDGKLAEAFRMRVEFKNKATAGGTALKAARFGLGGLKGGIKGMQDDKKAQDLPVMITKTEDGTAVIRGRQHILAYSPASRQVAWADTFDAPGMAGWQKFAFASMYAFAYTMNTAQASSTYYGTSENTSANNMRLKNIEGFTQVMNKRFSATKQGGRYVHILTNVEEGKDKGPGLVAVNLLTGAEEYRVLLKDKEPDYQIDEFTGRIFNLKGDAIEAYSIR